MGQATIDVRVRPIESVDLASVAAISNWAIVHTAAHFATEPESEATWEAWWSANRHRYPWLAAEVDDRVIGFAKGGEHGGRCAYSYTVEVSVYVDPAWHGRGIGAAMYGRLFSILDAQGYRSAIARLALPNPASVRLHERFGFRKVGVLERVGWKFGRWHDVGIWQRCTGDGPPTALRPASATVPPTLQEWQNTNETGGR